MDDSLSEQDDLRPDDEEQNEDARASTLEDDVLEARLKTWFKQHREHWDPWRAGAKEDFSFVSGDQWSTEDISTLKEQMRPVIVFNRVEPVIAAVSGTEVGNRQEVRYLPRSEGDANIDEVLSNAAKWFRDQCDAEDEESDAFMDTIICGVGCTETRLDFELDPEGAPIIDRIDPFEMYADPSARKRNFEDGRRIFRVRRIPKDEALALVPDADPEDIDATWANEDEGTNPKETVQESRFYRGGSAEDNKVSNDLVTLVECQWWERETVHLVADPETNQVQKLSEEGYKTFSKRAPGMADKFAHVAMTKRVYQRAYIGAKLLLVEPSPFKDHFSYKFITGKRDRNKGTYYGLVRSMKDPQRWANKWLSQTLHIMNTNAKGGVMAEEGAATDQRDFEKTWARPDAVTWLKQGALTGQTGPKIVPKPASTLPQGYYNLLEFAIQSVRDASGVNLELLGMKDNDQAGVLEAQRKKQAMALLATLFDSLRRYRKSQGRLLLYIIQTHLSDGRLIRIVGDEGEKYVPLIHEKGVAEYDVRVDDAPSSPQQKDITWAVMMQMMPAIKDQMTPELWAAILPYSPLPASVVSKVQKIITDGAQQRQQKGQQADQLHVADATATIGEKQSQANLNNAKAQAEGPKAQAHLIQAVMPPAAPAQHNFPQ